ncbi:MAG: GAF domain-containing protein, partial [Acidimicrobiales bacterium]
MQGLGHTGAEQLRRLLGAVVGIGSGLELGVVLERIVETAVELIGATYGALGVLDPSGTYLADFITVGLTEEQRTRIGDLPRGHGILGLLIVEPVAIRLPDLTLHPDSYGFPPGHPPMTSFLGVPLFVRGKIYGNLYLT